MIQVSKVVQLSMVNVALVVGRFDRTKALGHKEEPRIECQMSKIVGALCQAESSDDTSVTCFLRLRCLAPSQHVSGYRSQNFVQRLISMFSFTETKVVVI